MEGRKRAVSIRLNSADVRNVRKLSRRLGVRTSDIIRFAIKTTLARLGPLHQGDARGIGLVPVLAEAGSDLVRYLELDAEDLESIINDGATPDLQMEHADVELLAMSGQQQPCAQLRLVSINGARRPVDAMSSGETAGDEAALAQTLRRYLFQKYVYEHQSGGQS